ncbi:hypothetical protein QUV83_08135 [Cellulomonas cellasea]|uniref:hypothetical protein n=1 Tax=Cellulomonas cellasea TaxID=43670 RepID=UPI0025A3FA00|nr:hypothetical protein [Cellulomonas cellasea]MDM8084728.1 hypothetical protein [Cellulomonas cellasea]
MTPITPPSPTVVTTLTAPDDPKMLRETLCVAAAAVARATGTGDRDDEHITRLQRLIDECDHHRPLGSDGKHGSLHTATCGCDDVVSPTVGDVITTAGELDELPVGSVLLDKGGQAVWRDLYDHWCAANGTRQIRASLVIDDGAPLTLLHRPDAPPAAPTATVDREALSTVVGSVLCSVTNYPDAIQVQLLGQSIAPLTAKVVDAVLAFLATQPTPSSVDADASSWDCDECGVTLTRAEVTDPAARQWLASPGAEEPDAVRHTHCPAPVAADAVERAVMAAARCDVRVEDADCAHMDDSMPCRCQNRFSYCMEHDGEEPQDPSVTVCPWAARIAAAALTAARAGEVQR